MIIRTDKLQEGNHIEERDGKIVLDKVVDINPVLEANYHARKDSQRGFSKDKSYRRIMSVPMEVMMMWKKEFPAIFSGDAEAENEALKVLAKREENKPFWTIERGMF